MCTAKPVSTIARCSFVSPSMIATWPTSRRMTPKKFSQSRVVTGLVGRSSTGTIRFQESRITLIGLGGGLGGSIWT